MGDEAWDRAGGKSPFAVHELFSHLTNSAPAYLHFSFPAWGTRDVCDQAEQDPANMIMGTDGSSNCVYWTADVPQRWEMLNDGSCDSSSSDRAAFATQEECEAAAGATKWTCV